MPTTTKSKLNNKKRNRILLRWVALLAVVAFVFLCGLYIFFFTRFFNIKSFEVVNDSAQPSIEKSKIENLTSALTEGLINKNIFFLSSDEVLQTLQSVNQEIKSVKLKRSWDKRVQIEVTFFKPIFVACEKERQFLISCMYGEASGIFYKEAPNEYEDAKNNSLYFFEISRDVLAFVDESKDTLDNRLNIDSLVGTRIYGSEEMRNLLALLRYLEQVNYSIKKVSIKSLRIVEVETDKYKFIFSLQKGYADTVKDLEIFTTNESTKKILENKDLEVIDLSYKDKIFYKLHFVATPTTATTTEIFPGSESSTITTTTATTSDLGL